MRLNEHVRSKRIGYAALIVALVMGVALMPLRIAPAHAEGELHVIASFSILADVASRVAGDVAQVDTLIPLGANPHSFEPSARDVMALSDADVVLTVGLNFEENLLAVLQEAAADRAVTVSACVPALPILQGVVYDVDESETAPAAVSEKLPAPCAEHHAQVAEALGLERLALPGAVGVVSVCEGETPCDPHVWTDPANVALWTLAVRDALSARDPANAEIYAANAEAYLAELAALHADIQTQIATVPPERRVVVTNHLVLHYFAARYGLRMVGVVIPGGSTSAEPSVQQVLALVDAIRENHTPAIFTDTTAADALARQVAEESGAEVVALYTGSLSEADGPAATYLDYMRTNTARIVQALGGETTP